MHLKYSDFLQSVSLPYSKMPSHYVQPGLRQQLPRWPFLALSHNHSVFCAVVQLKHKSDHADALLKHFCDSARECEQRDLFEAQRLLCLTPFTNLAPSTFFLIPLQPHSVLECSLPTPGLLCSLIFLPGMLLPRCLNGSLPHFLK